LAVLIALVITWEGLWAAPAFAQSAPVGASATSDLVKLKDGSLYRGTITELVPKSHVVLLLPSGESRRFSMADVVFAGAAPTPQAPAPSEPAPAPPAAEPKITVLGSKATVHLTASEPDTQFLLREGQSQGVVATRGGVRGFAASHYADICTAPCDATLPEGSHRLALSRSGGAPVETTDPIVLSGPSTLKGTYISQHGTRVTGVVLLVVGLVVGTTLEVLALSVLKDDSCTPDANCYCPFTFRPNVPALVVGGAIEVVGLIAGLALTTQRDHAIIEVVPQSPTPLPVASGVTVRERPATPGDSQGLALRIRF
jgi:hypothetical protein